GQEARQVGEATKPRSARQQLGAAGVLRQGIERGAQIRRPLVREDGRFHRPSLPGTVLIRCRSNDLVSGIVTQYDWSIRFWQESAAPRLRLAMRIGHQRASL